MTPDPSTIVGTIRIMEQANKDLFPASTRDVFTSRTSLPWIATWHRTSSIM